ncbi:MAG TPA: AcrB/AcrD/AcrF family protein [Herpetosiphon sp.]|uniref:Acriflavin resistance protein n=1 Tax=Herpetosiphon aurantiacus (strain ATCC 23779 / DSM 785 / 114-95) TaxID=316274 RepID=A9AY67_HERA2|nr:efflux RND transporter permease subunit [Herpetosiphon sp.]ABX06949.1 acriflavin resistance protein [Herpetosiphon aurantiacus DSM 785]HBW48589.1 AcrB/AcrD/AcrF family protein [Herpetosiphon sp.]
MLWFTRQSLKRSPITIMISVVLIIAGLVASAGLKRELFPDISFPIVSITTIYPGASSETMDSEVTSVIEKAVNGLSGVQAVQSTSSESFAFTILTFDVDVDPKDAKVEVQEKISSLALPENAQKPTIGTFDFNSLPIVVASVSGENLSNVQARVDGELIPALSAIPGVNNVAVTGGQQEKVLITLDPEKMAANNLTQAQVVQFLQANNLVFPVGTITDEGRSLPLRITHKYSSTNEIENVVVGIKGVDLTGGAGGGLGGATGGFGGAAAQPTAAATPSPTQAPTQPVTTSLIPAALQGFGITSPDQITPAVIAQFPDAGLSQITLPLALALSDESQAALAQRYPEAEVPAELVAFGISAPDQITPAVISQFPAAGLAQFPINLALALPEASQTALSEALAAAPAAPPTPSNGASALPPEFANFGITSPEQITPELIDQIPAQFLSAFTPELIALLSDESQAAIAQKLNNPDAAGSTGVPEALLIRLKDVGTVEVGAVGGSTVTRTNGQASLGLEISKDTTGNTVEIVEAVEAEFAKFNNGDLKIQIVSEQATPINQAVSAVLTEGAIGAVVAIVVIFLFLRSLRTTLVTAVSIPLSIMVALILMRLQGFSLNVMTLGGLTVAVGRVVDDSIVVLENIYRYLNKGANRREAVIEGTKEVAGAITSSTLTTVCVFLPLGLVGGIVSKFFLPFALTVTYALLASLIVAITIVPLLAFLFIRQTKEEPENTWMQRAYTPALLWALRNRAWTLVIAFALLLGSFGFVNFLKFTFLPDSSEKLISIQVFTPAGTDLDSTVAKADEIEKLLLPQRDAGKVRDIQTVIGSAGGANRNRDQSGGASAPNSARFSLTINNDNVTDPTAFAKELEAQIKGVAGLDSVAAEVISQGGGPGNAGLDITLVSSDINKLREANDKIMAAIGGNNASDRFDIANVKSGLAEVKPELEVAVDPKKAIGSGTSTAQIALQIRALLTGENAGTVQLDGTDKPLDIYVQVDPAALDAEKLKALEVGTINPVPLSEVATISEVPGASSIVRINGDRATSISGQFTSDDTFSTQAAVEAEIRDNIGLPEGVIIQAGAQAQSQTDTFNDMFLALGVAVILVYLVMVLSFGSLMNPLIILFSLPLAIIGVLTSLFITGKPLGITTMIGVLLLIGIVVTNAIVLIELVEQYREDGKPVYESLVQAARVRLRPILMTAIATMVALLPLALGLKEGGFIGADLGIAVIGGLFTSTFLTLLVVPVVYSLIESVKTRFGFADKHGKPEADVA